MPQLPNFPLVDQLTTITGDGQPSENAAFDCVAASLCAAVMYLNGIRQVNAGYNPDRFKDAAYGQGYRGGTAASQYIQYAASLGVRLYPVQGPPAALVMATHAHLAQGHPVIFTIPDPYSSQPGWSHVECFYGWDTGSLTSADPWKAQSITRSDDEWANLLEFNEIWVCERTQAMTIPQGWSDDGTTLKSPNGVPVVKGFRDHVLSNSWDPNDWALAPEAGRPQLELSNASLGGGTWQPFRTTVLEWTESRGVFRMWVGQEIIALRNAQAQQSQSLSPDDILIIGDVKAATKLISDTATHVLAQVSQLH